MPEQQTTLGNADASGKPIVTMREVTDILKANNLRATRPRMALARTLFNGQHKHFSADDLQKSMEASSVAISLTTIYSTLEQFCNLNLISCLGFTKGRAYYDTNTEPHFHFYDQSDNNLIDFPKSAMADINLPKLPDGTQLQDVDVIIRVRKTI